MTAPAAGLEDLSPAPRADLMGLVVSGAAPGAGRLSFFAASAASAACLRSGISISHSRLRRSIVYWNGTYPSQQAFSACASRNPPRYPLSAP